MRARRERLAGRVGGWGSACALVLSCGAFLGCEEEEREREYAFLIHTESDPGRPLAGVEIQQSDKRVGLSGEEGSVQLKVRGKEGESMPFRVLCPEGHKGPRELLSLTLRSVGEKERFPEFFVRCEPQLRSLVVVVRAENGADLPVRYLGRELARTDESGAGHLLLRLPPHSTVEVGFDTSARPELRPANPVSRFELGDRDEIVVVQQKFWSPEAPKRAPRAAAPKGPVKIR